MSKQLRTINPKARMRLIKRVPPAPEGFDRDNLIEQLPMVLESALDLILVDFEALPGQTQSSAVGCRILAGVIARLKT